MSANQLITEHIDLWTSTIKAKNSQGRGSSKKRELYGIKKLRELILELAVRGKLVPQDPSDEPASVLLEYIATDKEHYVKDNKIRSRNELPEVTDEEKPFDLPQGWKWSRLGKLSDIVRGVTYKKHDASDSPLSSTLPLMRANNIGNGLNFEQLLYIPKTIVKAGQLIVKGDVLIAMSSGSANLVGKAAQAKNDLGSTFGAFCAVIRPFSSLLFPFIGFYCTTPIYRGQTQATGKGMGIQNLNKGAIELLYVPVSPLAEQHRIVAKVDELMALCDQLEQQTESSLDAHNLLVDTLLSTLTDAHNANELSDNWSRLADHFDTLITTDYAIEQLKQTILQLAVQGKLVPQDPNDEPASELLKRIAAEKEQLIKDKKIKAQKPLPPINDKDKIFYLPDSWQWCRMDDICFGITSGSTPPKSEFNDLAGAPYLKVYNIRNQLIDFEYRSQFVNLDYHSTKLKRSVLYPGDVIMNIVGPPLGKVAIIPNSYPEWNCNQAITFFRPIEKNFNLYIYTYIKAGVFLQSIDLIGTAGQDNISVTKSRSIALPVPPLEEQYRIVAKVDELMTLCDQLKTCLTEAQIAQLHLADTMVKKATS